MSDEAGFCNACFWFSHAKCRLFEVHGKVHTQLDCQVDVCSLTQSQTRQKCDFCVVEWALIRLSFILSVEHLFSALLLLSGHLLGMSTTPYVG